MRTSTTTLMVPADGGISGDFVDFQTFNKDTKLFDNAPEVQAAAQDGFRPMRRHLLQTCNIKLNALENELRAYITKSCTSLNASECFRKFTVVEHAFQLLAWMLRFSAMKLAGTLTYRSTRTSSCTDSH